MVNRDSKSSTKLVKGDAFGEFSLMATSKTLGEIIADGPEVVCALLYKDTIRNSLGDCFPTALNKSILRKTLERS